MRAWVWMTVGTPRCGAKRAGRGSFVRVPACRVGLRGARLRAASPAVAVNGQRRLAAPPP